MAGRREPRRVGTRRALPPRPMGPGEHATVAVPSSTHANRPSRLVEREAPYLIGELKRVALVTATCIGLLAFLTVVDRMR